MLKDLDKDDEVSVSALPPFERIEEEEEDRILLSHYMYQASSTNIAIEGNHNKPSVSLTRIERKETSWFEFKFESKAQSHHSYAD